MQLFKKLKRYNFFIRFRSWEYWPFGLIQFPLFIYWLWLSFRARSLLFFSASNPVILMGGMFGESKVDTLKRILPQYIPNTVLVKLPATLSQVLETMRSDGFKFPVIFKPDLGERGFMVNRIDSDEDIADYLKKIKTNFIIQELVDLPVECGVYYIRYPNNPYGEVTSLVIKEMLMVEGNGQSTLAQLILAKDRAKLQWNKLKEVHALRLQEVIPAGEKITLSSIGNHCLGSKFLNGEKLINEKLTWTFDRISKHINGFYFGRYDLRTASIEDLYSGNVKIMELNGCGAEPGHIYEPGYSLIRAYKVLFRHWKNLYIVSKQNRKRGVNYLTLKEGLRAYRKFKKAVQ